jgi:hypothetical protein
MLVIEFTQLGTSAHVSLCVPNPARIPRPTSAGMGRWIGKGRHNDLPKHLPIGIWQTCAYRRGSERSVCGLWSLSIIPFLSS